MLRPDTLAGERATCENEQTEQDSRGILFHGRL
jgi:hypothetical protein